LRVLIVDDERLARRGVLLRLSRFEDMEVVGECGDGASAVEKILELSPDLVFLDVHMPGMGGFDVLRALPRKRLPAVIFLTAYEQHALRAFEVHALDYLLKPVDDERFTAAVERAQRHAESALKLRMAERVLKLLDEEAPKRPERLVVRLGTRLQVVPVDEIDWIAAAGDYVELHVHGRSHLLRESMSSLEQKLDPGKFMRIHRSRIVCAASIVELSMIDNREYRIKLSDGSEHRSSRTYADQVEKWLESGKLS
jgi:two-component system, LytTR family, response regulator